MARHACPTSTMRQPIRSGGHNPPIDASVKVGPVRSEKELAAESDLLQAIECCAFLDAERTHLAKQLTRLNEALAAATTSSGGDVSGLRRTIRQVDSDLRQIDRMIEAIESRFPAAVERRA